MGAGASMAGSLVSGAFGYMGQRDTNKTNRAIANEQQRFEAEQAATIYQRGVEDLKAAGLNPMLAVAKPAGQASYDAPTYKSPMSTAMENGISNFSALQTARQSEAQIDNIKSQANLNNALVAKAAADTTSALAGAQNIMANTDKTKSGPVISSFVGSDMAKKISQFFNSALDTTTDKVSQIINGTYINSGHKIPEGYDRYWSIPGVTVSKKKSRSDLPPPPPLPSYWENRR